MSNKNLYTKQLLADAFRSLLRKLPLSKITVKDLVDACELSRNAYYYYFHDKYDLMNWIIEQDLENKLHPHDPNLSYTEFYRDLIHMLHENSSFYSKCFSYDGQNSAYQYLREFLQDLAREKIRLIPESKTFTPDEILVVGNMIGCSLIDAIRMWHEGRGLRYDCNEYIDTVLLYIDRCMSMFTA